MKYSREECLLRRNTTGLFESFGEEGIICICINKMKGKEKEAETNTLKRKKRRPNPLLTPGSELGPKLRHKNSLNNKNQIELLAPTSMMRVATTSGLTVTCNVPPTHTSVTLDQVWSGAAQQSPGLGTQGLFGHLLSDPN